MKSSLNIINKIKGYHGTSDINANKIIDEGFKIKEPRQFDNHWLGHGIYFYDNLDLALWWAKTKVSTQNKKYNNNDTHCVLCCDIQFIQKKLLDLDKFKDLDRFFNFIKEYEKYIGSSIQVDFSSKSKEEVERIKKCIFLDLFKKQKNIDVVMYTFSKKNPGYGEYNTKYDGFGLTYNEKQICVTNNDNIVNKYKYDEEDDYI